MLTALAIGSLLLSPQDPSTAPGEFQTLFNGSSLEGWWGCSWDEHEALHTTNGATLYEVSADELDGEWFVSDGRITSIGSQLHLSTLAEFGDFEFRVEYRLEKAAYGGISLRGRALLEIWDATTLHPRALGLMSLNDGPGIYAGYKGSGGLRGNARWTEGHYPSVVADSDPGEWNELRLVIVGERLSVWLNDLLILDHVNVENEFGRGRAFPRRGPLELVCYRGPIEWRNVRVRELGPDEGLQVLTHHNLAEFAAIPTSTLTAWTGATSEWKVVDDALRSTIGGSTIYATQDLADFTIRLEYLASRESGGRLMLRSAGDGSDSSGAIEVPLLGSTSSETQFGSPLCDTIARRAARSVAEGQWNSLEVILRDPRIRVDLNGCRVLECQLPIPGDTGANTRGTIALVAGRAGLSVRNVLVHALDPSWPSLEPFMASRFWEAVPAFSGVKAGSRHTPDTLKAAADMAERMFADSKFAKDAADSLTTGERPVYEEPGDAMGLPAAPIVMHALAPLWDDEAWDEADHALAEACAALLARLPDGPMVEFSSGDIARNHETLGAIAIWFRAQVSSVSSYAAMIYTMDDGPWRPVAAETDPPAEVEERIPIGLDAELRLLARGQQEHQVLEVTRSGRVLHRILLTKIPGQHRLTFDQVADALDLGHYGWRVQMRFGVPGDIELMTLYFDAELRPLFYFTAW